MALSHISRVQLTLGLLGLLGLASLAVMTLAPSDGGRTGVVTQLEKPAIVPAVRVGPGPVNATTAVGGYTVAVRAASNNAAQAQLLNVRLTSASGPLIGAHVTVSYSMPSMNMPSVLTAPLPAHGGGAYGARVKAVEMPGDWLLSFRIVPAHGQPFVVALTDRMPR